VFDNPPCKGKTNLFFPPLVERDIGRPLKEQTEKRVKFEQRAIKICARCPYQEPCLDWALKHEVFGIWGGTTSLYRKELRKERKVTLKNITVSLKVNPAQVNLHPYCGSEQGFQWSMDNLRYCATCERAHEAFLEGLTITPEFTLEGNHPNCGSELGYQILAKRCQALGGAARGFKIVCEACRAAHREYNRQHPQQRRS